MGLTPAEAGLPVRLQGALVDQLEGPARLLVPPWVASWRPQAQGLAFLGPPAPSSKAAAAVAVALLERGVLVRFAQLPGLFHALRADVKAGRGDQRGLELLVRAEVLVLDQVGAGKGTAWELSVLDQLVSRRYNSIATCVLSSSYTLPELRDRVGDRIVSRLHEACLFVPAMGA